MTDPSHTPTPETDSAPEASLGSKVLNTFALPQAANQSDTVTIRLRGEAYKRITAEARRVNVKKGTLIRELALEYLRLRDDQVSLGTEGSAVAQMFTASEQRIVATLTRQDAKLDALDVKLSVLIAIISAFLKQFYLSVPAPRSEADIKAALPEAERRYNALAEGVPYELDGDMPQLLTLILSAIEKQREAGQ